MVSVDDAHAESTKVRAYREHATATLVHSTWHLVIARVLLTIAELAASSINRHLLYCMLFRVPSALLYSYMLCNLEAVLLCVHL